MNKSKTTAWLFNPFQYIGGNKGLFIGLFILALHIPIGYFLQVRFDGALDMHLGLVESYSQTLIDVLIAWTTMFLMMYITARLFNSPIRLIDIAGATAISRVPLLISVLPAKIFDPGVRDVNKLMTLQGSDLWMLVTGSIILLIFLMWFFVLLFNAFKINSNLKDWKLIVGFILSIIIAEIFSKIALANI